MELKKYKLEEILDVTRGASLSGEFYATEGKYIRLTCGNFDYQNNLEKPRDFDPFGHAGFAHLWLQYD